IIMAQPQRPADVHQDKLCLPNKRYALMDANKKIDLDNPFAMIYLGQFWHTLQEGGSKYRLKFMLDRKEITMTLNDFRRIFHLPQATDNNHERFVVSPKFSEMVPFFLNTLGFTLELRSSFNFKTTGLVQPWQTLGKIFARCLITRVNGQDQLPLQIMQMLYCFVNNIHVDYVDLLGARDKYNNLEDDVMVKNIFNSGKHKNSDGMTIPSWMITDEMKLTNHYRMYATVFGVDVPMTQTQPIESTQGTHRTTSATTIRLHTIQLSLAKQKSHDELEAKQNVQKVEEHLIAEEIEKLVEGLENVETVEVASSTLRKNDNPIDLGTRLEPRSDKESPEVEITADAQHVNVNEEEEESIEDDYELKRMEKGKETRRFKRYKSFFDELQRCYGYLFEHLKIRFMLRKKFNVLAQHLQEVMEESWPKMVNEHVKELIKKQRGNDAKRQKTSEHGTFVSGESLSGQDYESGLGPSTSCNQEQSDDFDFWMDSYATDDDELPTEKVSQELVDEMLKSVDEAKLRKVNDVLWERRKEILVSPYPQRPTPVVQSCLSYPKAPALSLVNQDLLYLKKGSSGPKKIVMSLHKFPATYWELGHEYKLITEIVARRANGSIVSITESDYKNLNKNDIEDMYLLMVHGKLGVESYQHKVNLTAPTITFPSIEKFKVFSIISEPVYGIIYKNNQKEKRVMRHQEIHKFYDATLKRVLEGLKRYNHDVKHGYVTPSLSKEDAKYMQLFEEEIEERLRHRDQMRRWERQLGSRRERLPTDLRLSYLSVTKSTRPPHATDEDSEREEENAFFLARSRPIGRTSHTSSPEPSASSFKFKPPCIEPKVISEVFALPVFYFK
ncbi:hypothetical protein Tco_1223878, partial [Tanacetum coccineum]